ncbi:MAG: aspartate 1-decarboxylase [Candidatus Hydrogenedentota bacterium]
MLISMFKSKIHRATVTQADLEYRGSLTVDRDLMDAAGLRVHEQIHVLNVTNGQRFTTYVIEGGRGTGVMCLNGACARLGAVGDKIIALAYAQMTPEEADTFVPVAVHVDHNNRITEIEGGGIVDEAIPLGQ